MASWSRNDDKIPNEADYIKQKQQQEEWQRTHEDPRHMYVAEYTFMGSKRTEEVMAMNAEEAEKLVKQQWSMVGVNLTDLKIQAEAK